TRRSSDHHVKLSIKGVKNLENKELSFEEALEQLESIVKKLEEPDVPIEKAIKYYEKGMELSKICDKVLSNAEKQMTQILGDNDQPTLFDMQEEKLMVEK